MKKGASQKIREYALMTILIMAVLVPLAEACVKTSDDYAVEAVLNKPGIDYNLQLMLNAKNIVFKENKYIYESRHQENILVIISEADAVFASGRGGISIKLQRPTITEREEIHKLKLLIKTMPGTLNSENLSSTTYYEGWHIECTDERTIKECKYLKDNTKIKVYLEDEEYNALIEITDGLDICTETCTGTCIRATGGGTCIDNERRTELERLFQYSGLINEFNELLQAYTVLENGIVRAETTNAYYTEEVNWAELMRKELLWLKSHGIIKIQNADIEEISRISKEGMSGQNNRILYAKNKMGAEQWLYYKDSIEPKLKLENECEEITKSAGITGSVIFETGDNRIYYMIPVTLTIIFLLTATLAVLFSRWNHERKKNREFLKEKMAQETLEAEKTHAEREKKN